MAKKIEYSTLTALRDELNAILGDAPAASPAPAVAEADGESFEDMSYNDLKKLCKSRGVSPAGDRKALIARLSETDSEDEETEESEEEETPAPKSKKSAKGKKSAPVEEEEEESEDEDDSDDVAAQVAAATEDMSTEELAEFCTDNGLSPKGKRESLLARIVKAVEAGDIELSSDDDESEEDEEEEEEKPAKKSKGSEKSTSKSSKKSKKDEEEEEEESEEDEEGEETEERKTALKAYEKDTRSQFKKGEIDRGDIIEFLADFNDEDKKTYKKMSDGALIDAYIDASSMLINDEGEIVEEGAYTVNGVPYCCGHELSYDEDSGKYVCEHCGEEYEADED